MIARRANNLNFGFSLAAIAVLAMIATPNVCGQEETEPQAAAWSFVFRVVDEDGVTLKDATIKTKVNKKSDSHQQLPNGDFRITFDSKPKHLRLQCKSDGKTPINATWRENEMLESSEEVLSLHSPRPSLPAGGSWTRRAIPLKGQRCMCWHPAMESDCALRFGISPVRPTPRENGPAQLLHPICRIFGSA